MKAVNLLPQDQRRVRASGARSGSAYALVGGLAVLLIATVVYAVTANEVATKNAEADTVAAQANAVEAEVAALAPFGEFSTLRQTRVAAVEDVARGRLDWERLTRELALVLPRNTWLLKLDGDAVGDGSVAPGTTDTLSGPGAPSVLLTGCAKDQPSVATALVRLRRINGASGVELQSSKKPEGGGTGAGGASCGTDYEFTAKIELEPAAAPTTSPKPGNVPAALGGGS
jgi:Tfp pilus assembly protein PilN